MTKTIPDFTPIPEGVAYFDVMARVPYLTSRRPKPKLPIEPGEKGESYGHNLSRLLGKDPFGEKPEKFKRNFTIDPINVINNPIPLEELLLSYVPNTEKLLKSLPPNRPSLTVSSREERVVLVEQSDGTYVVRRGYIPESDPRLFLRGEGTAETIKTRGTPYTLQEIVERAQKLGKSKGAPVVIRPSELPEVLFLDDTSTIPQEYKWAVLIALNNMRIIDIGDFIKIYYNEISKDPLKGALREDPSFLNNEKVLRRRTDY